MLTDYKKMSKPYKSFAICNIVIIGIIIGFNLILKSGEIIAPARLDGKRTPAGRYTNHSKNPNSIMILRDNNDIDLVAKKVIKGCQGGNLGEEITIDYRQALSLAIRRI